MIKIEYLFINLVQGVPDFSILIFKQFFSLRYYSNQYTDQGTDEKTGWVKQHNDDQSGKTWREKQRTGR